MNFFEHQERAKKNTAKLILLFIVAVICVTAAVTYIVWFFFIRIDSDFWGVGADWAQVVSPLQLSELIAPIFVTIAVIFFASLGKIVSLSSNGGEKIANMLNAREIVRSGANFDENVLLNIVEEMSIASGVSAPPVFILNDGTINAFVAGNSYEDAIICVTEGAIQKLNRDELQGVIAHEFSHIFNGDMKLNIRSIGFLFGIVFISIIGKQLMSSIRGSRNSKGNGVIVVLMLGFSLYIIGSVGAFFANMIKAAMNRQREYLADASAVQFTRNPDGIGNALKKIGYFGSQINAADASEFSHLYIGSGVNSLFATHPPIDSRIKRIDPNWDGNFELFFKRQERQDEKKSDEGAKEKLVKTITAAAVLSKINDIGDVSNEQICDARERLSDICEKTHNSISNSFEAGLTIFCMLLDENMQIRQIQTQIIQNSYKNRLHITNISQSMVYVDTFAKTHKRERYLETILVCINALKTMSIEQYRVFKDTANALIAADKRISWFEWNIKYLVIYQLDIYFGLMKVPSEIHKNIHFVKFEVELFLSALSWAQTQNNEKAEAVFQKAKEEANLKFLRYVPYESMTNSLLTNALREISQAIPAVRKNIFEASVFCLNEKNGEFSSLQIESVHAVSILLRLPINAR